MEINEIIKKIKLAIHLLFSNDLHKRGRNDKNLVVIEIKKDKSKRKFKKFDSIKLSHLTTDYFGDHYNYRLGIALESGTNNKAGEYLISFFQNGKPISQRDLL